MVYIVYVEFNQPKNIVGVEETDVDGEDGEMLAVVR